MTEMGWISIDGDQISLDNDTVMADINSLPAEVAGALNGTEFETCVAKIGEATGKYLEKCLADYTDAEQGLLLSLVNAAANFECIQHRLAKSCNEFVSNNVRTMLGLPTGSGRFPF